MQGTEVAGEVTAPVDPDGLICHSVVGTFCVLGGKALRGILGFWVLEELIICAGQGTQLPHYYFSV